MKKIFLILMTFVSLSAFAGYKGLSNGAVVCWPDDTEVAKYGTLRIDVSLTDRCDFNVEGTMYIRDRGGHERSENFIIYAGSKKTYVDFEDLDTESRYYIDVEVHND